MGIAGVPVYGNIDLGSVLEVAEKLIKKIKKNKFTKEDLQNLHQVLGEIKIAIAQTNKN